MTATKLPLHDEKNSDAKTDGLPAADDPNSLLSYLQDKAELEKVQLTRELHDNLGGLIVAAMMDIAWVQSNWADAEQARRKLERVRDSLNAAIDLKRKLIEELRPTLLDNFGLFAALKWHFKHWCAAANLACTDHLPDREADFSPGVPIVLFRVVQECLDVITAQASATSISLTAEASPSMLILRLAHDGTPLGDAQLLHNPQFGSMKHRIERLGGRLSVELRTDVGSAFVARIPQGSTPLP